MLNFVFCIFIDVMLNEALIILSNYSFIRLTILTDSQFYQTPFLCNKEDKIQIMREY